jgi:hypothetical protein
MRRERSGIAGTTGVGAITLRLGIGGPTFTAVGSILARALTGAPVTIAGGLLAIVWGAVSYLTIRRWRSWKPRWNAGAGAVLSAVWSVVFFVLLLAALLLVLSALSGSRDSPP